MRKVFVLLLASLGVMLTMSLMFTSVASAQPACVVCYSSKEEAQQHVDDYVKPRDCFVWYDPINCPEENRHWRALSDCGWGCAHWGAHQLNLKCSVGCDKGYCIRISQITSGRTEITDLRCCKVGDIWTTDDKGHSGIVRQVDLENKKVEVESCSSNYEDIGGVGKDWCPSGICWATEERKLCDKGPYKDKKCYNPANPEKGCCKYLIFPHPIHRLLHNIFKYPPLLMDKGGDRLIWKH